MPSTRSDLPPPHGFDLKGLIVAVTGPWSDARVKFCIRFVDLRVHWEHSEHPRASLNDLPGWRTHSEAGAQNRGSSGGYLVRKLPLASSAVR